MTSGSIKGYIPVYGNEKQNLHSAKFLLLNDCFQTWLIHRKKDRHNCVHEISVHASGKAK